MSNEHEPALRVGKVRQLLAEYEDDQVMYGAMFGEPLDDASFCIRTLRCEHCGETHIYLELRSEHVEKLLGEERDTQID